MALDMSKVKTMLTNLESPGGRQKNDLVKLPKGDHTIRIVPYKLDRSMPFQELHFHYGINRQTFLCPKRMDNDPCPICEFASSVWKDFEKTGDENLKTVFKNLMPKMRVYVPIVVRKSSDGTIVYSEDNKNVKWWGISPKTYEELLAEIIASDGEGIDVTDPANGLDITVKMDNFMGREDRFAVSRVKTVRKPSPIVDGTEDELEALIDTCEDINEIFRFREISEMKSALSAHAGTVADEDSDGTSKDFSAKSDEDVKKELDDKFAALDGDDDKLPF